MTRDDPLGWAILIVANIPVYLILGRAFFDDWGGFFQCVRFWFTPDIISIFRGEHWDDVWAELKLLVFGAICYGAVYAEHRLFFGP